ncbi:unnamed protein product [Caenorhabditis auriculariae]|uniref:Transthyretin-like family protein n=1 Tax=Caenorhabditis auriculariae TaxID=2777116 RepID=A0A8S1GQH5_9PELO|nr:unnamed protein product [Caenorhabditis auriculariae]
MILRLLTVLLIYGFVRGKPFLDDFKTKSLTVDIRGRLLCNGEAMASTRVFLYDEDRFVDEFMSVATTNNNGYFKAKGKAKDSDGKIEPVIMFYHKCSVYIKPKFLCDLRTRVFLDQDVVNNPMMDVGTIDVADWKSTTKEHCSWLRWFLPA